ncbi:MAG: LysM peptidoglycan-binding domain-containing protein [Deltaproteobacteria bacterium]|nr:LysM peptidoglycan-binding domain-containing protein [Deltaproteobacteria bacterium]
MKTKRRLTVFLVAGIFLFCSVFPAIADSKPLTHTVVQGDTLWDICITYYGDPFLWPKLWEMNPFVTNPHLLRAGDIITLLEGVPVKVRPPAPEKTPVVHKAPPKRMGVDVSNMTDIEAIGALSTGELSPDGSIIGDEKEGLAASEGDVVYVLLEKGRSGEPGDLYTVCRKSGRLRHPLTKKRFGATTFNYSAKLELVEPVSDRDGVWKCRLVRGFRDVVEGDAVFRHQPISPCILPLPAETEISTHIVAVKDQNSVIGQYSVVYLAEGYNEGVRRGNVFDIVIPNKATEPEKIDLPDLLVGHLLIVESLPGTSAGLVIDSKREVSNGAVVKTTEWRKAQAALKRLPSCPVE